MEQEARMGGRKGGAEGGCGVRVCRGGALRWHLRWISAECLEGNQTRRGERWRGSEGRIRVAGSLWWREKRGEVLLEGSGGGKHGKDARHGLYRNRGTEGISSLPVTNIYGHFDHLLEANYRRTLGFPGLKPQGGPFCSTLFSLKSTNGGTRGAPKISLAGRLRAIRGVGEFISTLSAPYFY